MAAPVSLTGVVKTLGLQVWCNVSSSQNQCVLQLGFGHRFVWFRFCTLFYCTVTGIAAASAKSPQSCPTLCDPIDGSPPGSPVPGILQARTLQWVAISFSNAWKWKVKVKSLSRIRLCATPWTTAYQGPLSTGFSRH